MKWGVRGESRATRKRLGSYNKGMKLIDRYRLKRISSSDARKQYLDDKDKEWISKVSNDKNIHKVSARTTKEFKRLNKEIKAQFGGRGLAGEARRAINGSLNAAYHKTMKDAYEMVLADQTFSVYKLSPSRTREVQITPNPDGTLKATIVERQNPKLTKQRNAINKAVSKIKHSDSDKHEDDDVSILDGMSFIIIPDEDGFPDEVISALDDDLEHSGVMGMRWGVRRDTNRPGGADGKLDDIDKPIRSSLGKRLHSLKRERQWHSVLSQMENLTTSELTTVTKRIALENSLKSLSRSKIGTKSDKEDYLRREHMNDEELTRKVVRLKAKESLHNAVKSASKEQREFGQKVVQIGGALGVKYALNRSVSAKDLYDIVKNPKSSADKAQSDVLKVVMDKLKKQNNG